MPNTHTPVAQAQRHGTRSSTTATSHPPPTVPLSSLMMPNGRSSSAKLSPLLLRQAASTWGSASTITAGQCLLCNSALNCRS